MVSMRRILVTAILALATSVAAGGCEEEPAAVGTTGRVIDVSSAALSAGSIQWVNGTYGAGCVSRSGGWSLRISGSAAMDNAALSVAKNNTACVLTLTAIVADQSYTATPSIALGLAPASSASSFAPSGGGSPSFYANALLSSANFASDFVVVIFYSDNPSINTGSLTSGYAFVGANSMTNSVSSPNYTVSLGSLVVQVDTNYIVQSASGTANLTDGTVTGSSYFVDQGTLGASPTFAELDTAYNAASSAPTTISGSNPQVAASAFGLSGVNLTSTVYRTIVIRRFILGLGVPSYETFRIGFSHP